MENTKKECEKKSISKTRYNNRKECIKKKTMELATLCGVDACTIIYGPDGSVDSWPENPTQVKAVINNLKNLMSDPNNRKTVKDESIREVVAQPKGKEIESFLVNSTAEKANVIKTIDFFKENPRTEILPDESQKKVRNSSLTNSERLVKFIEKSSVHLDKSSTKKYHEELLKQLNSTLESVTSKIDLSTKNKQSDESSLKRKQVDCSEETGQKRVRINQAPPFPFDLNCLPPDEEVAPPPEIAPSTADDQLDRAMI